MTIQQIYNLAVEMGIKADLRGEKSVENNLKRIKEKYEKLSKEEKKEFDEEKLKNPYSDTRIIFGDENKKIKRAMAGIDVDAGELAVAKFLSDSKNQIDLYISHHPTGKALAALDEVMHLQAEVLANYGVPINIAESLLKIRMSEVARGVSPINHNKAAMAAKNLGIDLMCVHTPADNLVASYLDKIIKKEKPEYVDDLVKILKKIPEYALAQKENAGVKIFAGSGENHCGKIALTEITGGTEGSPKIYEKLANAGIGTIVGMHMSEEHKKEAEAAHINVVIAGHISSDSLGMNLFLDELEKKGIEIIPASGLIRVKRSTLKKS
ncbi:NGG1p interacting factor NIF3 [Candidatus Wolfebacteria bacterium]|nr:NGG1p interacting factor NIF3 [Candidatus Wolfebacteria bacterium]